MTDQQDIIKVKGVIATGQISPGQGFRMQYSEAALSSLADQLPGKIVDLHFDPSRPVGVVKNVSIDWMNNRITAYMRIHRSLLGHGFHPALSFICKKDYWFEANGNGGETTEPLRIVDELEIISAALVLHPADPGTTEIKPESLLGRILLWIKKHREIKGTTLWPF